MGDQLQAKLRKRLEALLKLPDNQACCDCRRRGPRWASANLGVFMCIECSGIHRNLGVHISFVRSVNLDTWSVKQVDFMEEWGNARAALYFEAELPSSVQRPKEGDSVRTTERFIRDKYELKKYIGRELPPRTEYERSEPEEPASRRRTSKASSSSLSQPVSINKPASAATVAPVKTPVKEEPNLLDFMEDTPASSYDFQAAPSQPFPQQQQQPQPQQQSPGFDQFQSGAVAQPSPAQQNNGLLQPVPAPPPKASANDILSMFNQPAPQMNMYGQPSMGMMNGLQMPMNMGMGGPPGQMNGMPQQMNPYGQQQLVQGFPPQQQGGMPPQQHQQNVMQGGGMMNPQMNMNMQMQGGMPQQQQMQQQQQMPPQHMNGMMNPHMSMMQQQPPQQMMGMQGQPMMNNPQMMYQQQQQQQQQMQQGGFPTQAPPPVPSHPPPQEQGVFNFGSPNSMANGAGYTG